METIQVKSLEEIMQMPFYKQFTVNQIKNQLRNNAIGLRQMYDRAVKSGKKVGGYTADQLSEIANSYENISK